MNGLQSPTLQVIELLGAGNFGNNGSSYPASYRYGSGAYPAFRDFWFLSFRPSLYVNL